MAELIRKKIAFLLALLMLSSVLAVQSGIEARGLVLFQDGFESGSPSAWSGTDSSVGETVNVVAEAPHHGEYSGFFTSNGGGGNEYSYCFRSISASEVYARGYFQVTKSGIADNSDRFYFIVLRGAAGNLAYAGWRMTGGAIKWCLVIRDGTSYVTNYSIASPSLDRWYCMELHWSRGTAGAGELWVDGEKVCAASGNTDSFGDATQATFGLFEVWNCGNTSAYADCAEIADSYIGLEPEGTTDASGPTTWIVDDDQPANFSKIGEAVFAAAPNDTILVREGTYREQVTIDKSLVLVAENDLTVLEGNGTGTAITVLSNNTQVLGFTIRNYTLGIVLGRTYDSPASILQFGNITARGNSITNCQTGISGYSLEGPMIINNTVEDCNIGLYFGSGSANESLGPVSGLFAFDNSVSSNNIGLEIHWGHGLNSIINNTFIHNTKGVWLDEGYDALIEGNLFMQSSESAIDVWGTDYSISTVNVTLNHILENFHGISIRIGPNLGINGTITNNTIEQDSFGLFVYQANPEDAPGNNNVVIYHNNFTYNREQSTVPEESGILLDAGYPTGGNYWSDSNGIDRYSGVYQNETGSDGICDFPIHGDNYPLISVRRANPLATFTIAPSVGILVNDLITFDASESINQDGNITSYEWDFGDGNTTTTSSPVINHTYSMPGTYNVKLMEVNDKGLNDNYSLSLTVQRMNSNISISIDRSLITYGENVTIRGAVTPLRPQTNVDIWYKYGSEGWVFLANAVIDMNGTYSMMWIPSKTGDYQVKANWNGDNITLPSESVPVGFSCMNVTTSITVSTSSSTAYLTYTVNVTGALKDMNGKALRRESVVLYYLSTDSLLWIQVASVKTNSRGGYLFTWLPPATGTFQIRVTWTGNATHTATERTLALGSVSYANQYVFSVESNSTLQGLVFDSQRKLLNFSVGGPQDSWGYSKVTVAKSLVPDIFSLKIHMDGVNYIYTVGDAGTAWLLGFTYRQSVHSVAIDLLGNNTFPVATPTFTPAGGSYSSGQWVTIECATPGATIRYTLDGSEPILSSPVYTGPILVNSTTTIKAKAYVGGMDDSAVASAEYAIGPAGGEWLIYAVVAVIAIALVFGAYLLMRSRKQRKVLSQKNWTGRDPYSPVN